MDFLPDSLRTILAFVVVLGVLVFIHELGHYLAARWRGVHVERFAVGFGRSIASWTDRRGTEWRVGWIPLGGYVKLHGQETPADAPPEVRATWRPGETFHDKPVRDRAIVVAAGPVANFLLAALLFGALYATVGRPVPPPQDQVVIGQVTEGSAAARAGFLPGDRIVTLDGEPVTRFEQVQRHVQPRAGQPVRIEIEREGRPRTLTVTPDARQTAERTVGVLGIGTGTTVKERLDPFSALWAGTVQTANISWRRRRRPPRHRGVHRLHGGAVGEPRPDQPLPHPGAGWRPPAVLRGGGDPRPAAAAQGAGIRLPRRLRAADHPVPLRHLERPDEPRRGALGDGTVRLI